jgi:hypothetical protein
MHPCPERPYPARHLEAVPIRRHHPEVHHLGEVPSRRHHLEERLEEVHSRSHLEVRHPEAVPNHHLHQPAACRHPEDIRH